MKKPLPYAFVAWLGIFACTAWADPAKSWDKASNVSVATLGLLATGAIWANDDTEGLKQWFYAAGSSLVAAEALKNTVRETRPDGSDRHSFPSAHAALAFSTATFISQRYAELDGGWSPAVYGLAAFTGLARVQAKKHHLGDVLAGGAMGFGASSYFTQPMRGSRLSWMPMPGGGAVSWVQPLTP